MTLRLRLFQDALPAELETLRLSLVEGLSEPFTATVDFATKDPDLDLEGLLWERAAIAVLEDASPDVEPTYVHGVIEAAELIECAADSIYRLTLRPQIHGLRYRVRSRIFQDMDVPAIASQIFEEAGIASGETVWETQVYPPRVYCTQWKESELAFVSRLLEEEGIYYWIEHLSDQHVVHFCDSSDQRVRAAPDILLPVRRGAPDDPRLEVAYDVTLSTRVSHDAFVSRDWNFETPDTPPQGTFRDEEGAAREYYEFPGRFADEPNGARLARNRLDAFLTHRYRLRGSTSCRRLRPNVLFQLDGYPDAVSTEYLAVRLEHVCEVAQGGGGEGRWETRFDAMPSHMVYRPERRTPRPRATGKTSAVVTGPAGQEIHPDRFGRVKVKFYWDREGAMDETSSCWVRTQQMQTSTTMVLPRIGWEVDVGFEHGDPDRPVLLHKVYNDETMPPYGLPGALCQSALQSSTTPGGGGTNEIRMTDTAGEMELFIHAQKDMNTMVGNDLTEEITANSTSQVGADSTTNVTGSESMSVGGNQSLSVAGLTVRTTAGSCSVTVGGTDDVGVKSIHSVTVAGSRTDDVGGLMNVLANQATETFNASHTRTVGGAQVLIAAKAIADAVGGNKTENVAGAKVELISGSKSENIGAAKALTAGLVTMKAGADISYSSDGAMAITSGGPMAIKCGADFAISGSTVTITVGNATLDGAGAKAKVSAGSIELEAGKVDAAGSKTTLKGGSVKYVK